jgi:hypothetical protein
MVVEVSRRIISGSTIAVILGRERNADGERIDQGHSGDQSFPIKIGCCGLWAVAPRAVQRFSSL